MAELIDHGDGRLVLAGRLTSETVVALESQGRALLKAADTTYIIDFAEVTYSSSAGVALMLAWLRAARGAGADLIFKNLPARLLGLLRVTGLQDVLPIDERAGSAPPAA